MHNVTSSSIFLTCSIILATILCSIMFMFHASGSMMTTKANVQQEETTVLLGENRYNRYSGTQITGSQLFEIIETCYSDEITVTVKNVELDHGVYQFNASDHPNRAGEILVAKQKINPNSVYEGFVAKSSQNGEIVGLVFTQK